MAYSKQTFTVEQVITANELNQIEDNISDHVHGQDGVSGVLLISDVQDLDVKNNSGTPTTQLDIACDVEYKGAIVSVSETLNAATTGVNGLDTGALAADTAYSLYLIEDGTNVDTVLSLVHTGGITYPSGYTNARWIGAYVTNGSSQFRNFKQLGGTVWFDARESVASSLASASYATQTLADVVPTETNRVTSYLAGATAVTAQTNVFFSDDGTNAKIVLQAHYANITIGDTHELYSFGQGDSAFIPISGDNTYYKVSANSITLYARAYKINL